MKRLALIAVMLLLSTSLFAKGGRVGDGIYEFTASDHHNFIWYRITKNGSRSMVALLRTTMGRNVNLDPFGNKRTRYDHEKYKDHFKFAFVRNPWERIVSCYFNKVRPRDFWPLKECYNMSFEEFVGWLDAQDLDHANIHVQRQSAFIPPEIELDFIGRVENYDSDVRRLFEHLGFQVQCIPRKNTSAHLHYSHYYNDRTRDIIGRLYEEDVVRFGYTFERAPRRGPWG